MGLLPHFSNAGAPTGMPPGQHYQIGGISPPGGGGSTGGPPKFVYFNRTGMFYLDDSNGAAIFEDYSGVYHVDEMTFIGTGTITAQGNAHNGVVYKSNVNNGHYFFGDTPFTYPNGSQGFQMFLSPDGFTWYGYNNTVGGSQRSTNLRADAILHLSAVTAVFLPL